MGHKIVGSTCVDHLTEKSKAVVNDFKNVVGTCNKKIMKVQGGQSVRGWKVLKNGHKYKTKKSNGNCLSATFTFQRNSNYKLVFTYTTIDMDEWELVGFVNDYNGKAGKAIYSNLPNLIEFVFLFEQYLESKSNDKDHLQRYFAERINTVMARMKWTFEKKKKSV